MKRKLFSMVVLCLALVLAFTGCSSSDDDDPAPSPNPLPPGVTPIEAEYDSTVTAILAPTSGFLYDIKQASAEHEEYIENTLNPFNVYYVNGSGNQIAAVRALGGKAIEWDHTGEDGVWATDAKVRADITWLSGSNSANAYLLVWNGSDTYELVQTGFFGVYSGSSIDDLASVSSLTFTAKASGTYRFRIDIVEVVQDGTGTAGDILAQQEFTITVGSLAAIAVPASGSFLSNIKQASAEHEEYIENTLNPFNIYYVNGSGNQIAAVRDLGGIAVTYDHTGDWTTSANVRANITWVSGNKANAYLLIWNGTNTYELVQTEFFGVYSGGSISGLASVSSLTFAATAPGTYSFSIDIVEVNATTGAVIGSVLEQEEFTITVN